MTDGFRYQGFIAGAAYEDGNAMLDWLTRVFGFRERSRYVDNDGRVRQAEMRIGDVDAHHRRVTAAGVHADPPADQDYGMRTYHVTDPEGYHWGFMQRLGTPYVQRIPTEEGGWKEILADAPD